MNRIVLVILFLFASNFTFGGAVAVIVNDDLKDYIEDVLQRYVSDLEAEGWQVYLKSWDFDTQKSPQALKEYLLSIYQSNGLEGAVFIGDLPVAKFKPGANNGVPNIKQYHQASMPSDQYFMDLIGEKWEDADRDGSLDKPVFQEGKGIRLEIWVSRIKASGLPSLQSNEVDLVKRYFDKNHAYRTGQVSFPNRNFNYVHTEHAKERTNLHRSRNYSGIPGNKNITITSNVSVDEYLTLFNMPAHYAQWVFHGHATAVQLDSVSQSYATKLPGYIAGTGSKVITSQQLASKNFGLNSPFAIPNSCWIGLHTSKDYFMGIVMFQPQSNLLVATSGTTPIQDFTPSALLSGLSVGKSFGRGYLDFVNVEVAKRVYFQIIERGRVLLGDGTLKLQKFTQTSSAPIIPTTIESSLFESNEFLQRLTPNEALSFDPEFSQITWDGIELPDVSYQLYKSSVNEPSQSNLIYSGKETSFVDASMNYGDFYWLQYTRDFASSKLSEFSWQVITPLYFNGLQISPIQRVGTYGLLLPELPVEGMQYIINRYKLTPNGKQLMKDKEVYRGVERQFLDNEVFSSKQLYYYRVAYYLSNHQYQTSFMKTSDLIQINYANSAANLSLEEDIDEKELSFYLASLTPESITLNEDNSMTLADPDVEGMSFLVKRYKVSEGSVVIDKDFPVVSSSYFVDDDNSLSGDYAYTYKYLFLLEDGTIAESLESPLLQLTF